MHGDRQSGAALLVTVVIILVLSVIAVTATNTNQLQQIQVRNNQQQLSVFNSSYDQLQNQFEGFERLAQRSQSPRVFVDLFAEGVGSAFETSEPSMSDEEFGVRLAIVEEGLSTRLQLILRRSLGQYKIRAPEFEIENKSTASSGDSRYLDATCYELELVANTQVIGSKIYSRQHRVIEFVDIGSNVQFSDKKNVARNGAAIIVKNADLPIATPKSSSMGVESVPIPECDSSLTCRCFAEIDVPIADVGKRLFKKSWWESSRFEK